MMVVQEAEKRMKVKKGSLAVRVGPEDGCSGEAPRFVIPISYLNHPLFRKLLESAQEVYGYQYSSGPLRLPCSVDDFLHLRWLIERESSSSHHHDHHCSGGGARRRPQRPPLSFLALLLTTK